ncbi:Hint domain-containing protein [Celeribacter sp. ULVN23_4]
MTGSRHHHHPRPPKHDDHCICFTPGSLIATVRGEVAVESLQEGDQIFTRDNGSQSIVWTGRKELTVEQVERKTDLIPVMIAKGALGNGLPERDLMVSPQHRVLLTSDRAALYFEDREVLTAAKHLVGLPGITRPALSAVTYIHFMCENHEVVLSNGAWTETFQPGNSSLGALEAGQRTEIFTLFPELETQSGLKAYTSARKTLKKHEAQLLLAD